MHAIRSLRPKLGHTPFKGKENRGKQRNGRKWSMGWQKALLEKNQRRIRPTIQCFINLFFHIPQRKNFQRTNEYILMELEVSRFPVKVHEILLFPTLVTFATKTHPGYGTQLRYVFYIQF
jgi:hypothetical protein